MTHTIEPFGYFKPEPFGWTDCAEADEGAIPLWDNNAMCAIEEQRDELLEELKKAAAYHRSHECYSEAKRIDEYIASVKGGA